MSTTRYLLLLGIVPAVLAGAVYELFLGHRHDYTGHFAAGYGGTYGALLMGLKLLPEKLYQRQGNAVIVMGCVACIALGALLELVAFRIAKWDEIDFCNQSLGATLAAIAVCPYVRSGRPPGQSFDFGLIVGIAFLGIGGCYAVA